MSLSALLCRLFGHQWWSFGPALSMRFNWLQCERCQCRQLMTPHGHVWHLVVIDYALNAGAEEGRR